MKKIFTSFLLSILIGLSIIGQVSTEGLLGKWLFNGNANDSSGNGNNGIVNGATLTSDRFENPNSAYSFDGNSIIDFGNVHPKSVNNFSVSIWFNANSINTSPCLLQNGITNQGFEILLGDEDSSFIFIVAKSISESNMLHIPMDSNLVNDKWHHAVCISDTGTIFVYFDGILADSITGVLGSNGTNNLIAGYDQTANSHWFDGSLDDILIYNRILTDLEIQKLFDSTFTGVNPISFLNNIVIYPNPTKSFIIIDYGDNGKTLMGYSINILNSLGQSVYKSNVTNHITNIDLGTKSGKGIYLVTLMDAQNNIIESKKIILQ